jgi:UDP-N-acetylmuramate-alanine ligase
MFEPVRENLGRAVLEVLEPGDVVLTMGAGDITKVGKELAEWLRTG